MASVVGEQPARAETAPLDGRSATLSSASAGGGRTERQDGTRSTVAPRRFLRLRPEEVERNGRTAPARRSLRDAFFGFGWRRSNGMAGRHPLDGHAKLPGFGRSTLRGGSTAPPDGRFGTSSSASVGGGRTDWLDGTRSTVASGRLHRLRLVEEERDGSTASLPNASGTSLVSVPRERERNALTITARRSARDDLRGLGCVGRNGWTRQHPLDGRLVTSSLTSVGGGRTGRLVGTPLDGRP
jgi:hypothetical protein